MPSSEPLLLLVMGIGTVVALAGLVLIVTLRWVLLALRQRWAESFAPDIAPTQGQPTTALVAGVALVLLVGGGFFALAGFLASIGSLTIPRGDSAAATFFGGLFTILGLIALLARRRLRDTLDTLTRMAYGRAGVATSLTPGTTLAVAIVVTVIGAAVLLWGLLG